MSNCGKTADQILRWVRQKESQVLQLIARDDQDAYKIREITMYLNDLKKKFQKYSNLENQYALLDLKKVW